MDEDTQAQENLVTETQDPAMPTGEQKTETVSEEETTSNELPDDAKERTKRVVDEALHKAKTYETQLKEERVRREYYENLFQSLQSKPEVPAVVDPETGLLNTNVLTDIQKSALEANQRAEKAENSIKEFQRTQENQAVYAVYPELNPEGEKFDPELHKLTASLALHSMVNPDQYGNRQLSFKEAATEAKKILAGSEKTKAEVAKEAISQLSSKEQASFEAGSSNNRSGEPDLDELKRTARGTDARARAARIELFERKLK